MLAHDARIQYRKLDFTAAGRILNEAPAAVMLDVRSEEEFITGHAAGAVLLPYDEVTADSAAAAIGSKDTPVLVYCRTGRRSRIAAEALLRLGYTRVYDLGSLTGWPYGTE